MASLTLIAPASGETQLVPVYRGAIGGVPAHVVNARELHAYLESQRQFADWVKHRIEQYGFEENQDFESFSQNHEKPKIGRPSKDYLFSLDMAKELSMVENNAKGREARRYFIAMERQALAVMGQKPINPQPLGDAFDRAASEARTAPAQSTAPEVVTFSGSWQDYALFLEAKHGCSYRAPTVPTVASTPAKRVRPVTEAEKVEILDRYTAGEPKASIARALGRHHGVVDRVIAAANDAQGDLFGEVGHA
jgi:phage anti-repressor protein